MEKIYEIIDHTIIFSAKGKQVEIDLRQLIWPCSAFSVFYLLFFKKSGFRGIESLKKLKCQEEDKATEDDVSYSPKDINVPAAKGWFISFYRKILRSPFGRSILKNAAKRDLGLDLFLKLVIPDKPTYYPIILPDDDVKAVSKGAQIDLQTLIQSSNEDRSEQFHFNTVSDYNIAYHNKVLTPLEVAREVIAAIKQSERTDKGNNRPRMRMIIEFHEDEIIQRAMESTERWQQNKQLSVFDGIPIAVKDEIFVGGYPSRGGLPIPEHDKPKELSEEGWMVRKLREGGAIFIGMANMHQMGIGVTGINQSRLHGTPRNPVNPNYPPGGSSSGSAAAVASGLCPVALGCDGGGSIRLPSGICGVVGAKASFSRISTTGLFPICDTIGHAGALCATVRDSAIAYGFLAGIDPDYVGGHLQPQPTLFGFEDKNLEGVKVGVDWAYFKDCEPEIAESCEKGVRYLVETCGATLVDISIPEIQESSRAHAVATLTEMYTYGQETYHKHHDSLNTDTEVCLGLYETLTAEEYFKAQKQRTRCMNIFKRLFKTVDCIITPAFGNFMPELDESILEYGLMNIKLLTEVTRYAVSANLTGIPAISVPVGYANTSGLPISIQIQTAWWREDLMFRIAHAMEGMVELRKPKVYYDLIGGKLANDVDLE